MRLVVLSIAHPLILYPFSLQTQSVEHDYGLMMC